MRSTLREALVLLKGLSCTHPRMRECHPGCGHWTCPDCRLYWDDGEGRFCSWGYQPSRRVAVELEHRIKERRAA